jgi:hypothetical protein
MLIRPSSFSQNPRLVLNEALWRAAPPKKLAVGVEDRSA